MRPLFEAAPSRWCVRSLLAAALGVGLVVSAGTAPVTAGANARAAVELGSQLAPFDAVDQFIGTRLDTTENKSNDAYGNTFPGAAVPFGMVQPSPTTYKVGEPNDLVREKGGYEYTANQIRGFGMTRYSGSGCHGRFGGYEFPTIPYAGALDGGTLPVSPDTNLASYFLDFDHADEVAEPGYYSVTTANEVKTELTASTRTAVSRFDFPATGDATLILDASGANNRTFGTEVTVNPATRTVSGWMYGTDLCDNGNFYRAYFSTTYDQPFTSWGTWNGATMTPGATHVLKSTEDTGVDYRHDTGAWLTFADDVTVTAKTGFSYVSVENAAENRDAEVGDATFDAVRAAAKAQWVEALGTLDVTGGDDERRTEFYTAVYHALLHPNVRDDVDGQYVGYDQLVHTVAEGRHFYKNFAGSGWDMYRSQGQLVALLFPEVAADILESMVLVHDQTGTWQPGAARMQGDNLQVIIATLDDMGIRDYRREEALAGMATSQRLPATNSGRSDALQYFATGFLENRKSDSATSRVLEYATDDFAIAQLAESLGDEPANDFFMARSQSWLNVLDPQTRQIRPRERTGFDRAMDLRNREDGSGRGQFNQSTGLQYGWMVPHNMAELIVRKGGRDAAMRALDSLMERLDAGAYTQTGNYLSNQPAFPTPWVYAWLGAPHKTTDILYRADAEMYDATPAGLPGNDDQGALSAWYVFSQIGMFPAIYGTGDMILTAPQFEKVVIDPVGSDRVITVNAPGVSSTTRYATGLSVNGTPQTKSWVDAAFVRAGGSLDFTVSSSPGTWGTGVEDVPPSYGEGLDARNNVGTTPNGARAMGSMDLSDWSFSRETLAAAGAAPGQRIAHPGTGITFTWPDTEPGEPDNWIPNGHRVDLEDRAAGSISFLGLATNGPSTGTAVVEYTDGSSQQLRVTLSDWGNANPGNGNTTLVTVEGRNNANGNAGTGTFRVFATRPAPLDSTKTVDAVRLPEAGYSGLMHIFDVATSEQEVNDPNAPTGVPDRIVLTTAEDPGTSQYVTWRSRSALRLDGKVEIRTPGGEVRTVDAEEKAERDVDGYPSRSHSAKLTGLTPGTEYQYRVGAGSAWSDWATFRTASAGDDPFTFLYFGDAQEGINSVWPRSVDAAWAAAPETQLSLYAGDMVNTSTVEQEWDDWFNGITAEARATTALSTPGNHEIGPEPMMEHYLDSFEYDANGPVAADAGANAGGYGEHLAAVLKDSVTYSDYQGVRFVVLNANRDNICDIARPPGLATYNCDTARHVWMEMQAAWLHRVLEANPQRWSVVLAHQPVFSNGIADSGAFRDEDNWRRYVGPVIERHNVDLVLQGHDHAYGRGVMNRNLTDRPGVATGPVYVVANAGQKQYRLSPDNDNVWNRNGATAQVRAQDTSSFQKIEVAGDTLRYESVVTYVEGESTHQVGDTLDAFTITKHDNGAKWVTDAGVAVPGPEVPSESAAKPEMDTFDPATFGPVVWDDDFETDRLQQYVTRAGGSEALPNLSVDTVGGVLRGSATGRAWGHLSPPVEGGERWAIVVEPASFAGTGAAEDSLFVGASADNRNLLLNWYNHSRRETGWDFARDGAGKAVGRANGPLRWDTGDRIAFVNDHGEVSSWIEEAGTWRRYNIGLAAYAVSEEALSTWAPTFSLRLDPGTLAIERVTVLRGGVAPEPVVPAAVLFVDEPGTTGDRYVVPESAGVEYLVDGVVMAPGSHPGAGTVTVTARASGDSPIAEGATTSWTHTFSSVDDGTDPGPAPEPDTTPEPGQPADVTVEVAATHRPYGQSSTVSGTVTSSAAAAPGSVTLTVDGGTPTPVGLTAGRFHLALPPTLAAGRHTVVVHYPGGEGWASASDSVVVRIAKARPKVRLTISPRSTTLGQPGPVATVRVRLSQSLVTVPGKVRVRVAGQGRVVRTVRLTDGVARVRLPLELRSGTRRVSASYLGADSVTRAKSRVATFTVRR